MRGNRRGEGEKEGMGIRGNRRGRGEERGWGYEGKGGEGEEDTREGNRKEGEHTGFINIQQGTLYGSYLEILLHEAFTLHSTYYTNIVKC